MLAQKCDDLARVVDVLRHSQRQRFDALQKLERGKGCHARAEVAYAFAPRAKQECRSRRFFDENHLVKSGVRFRQRRKLAAGIGGVPSEPARVHQQAADQYAMA